MLTDVPAAGRLMARGELAPGAYLRSLRPPLELSLFARDDPLPAIAEPVAMAVRVARRRLELRRRAA
jgi:predicted ATP-grasp superfamily ATP-dependent carboligase